LQDKKLKVICAGVISHRKNHLATQEALQLLREQGWSVHFQIVGRILNQDLFEKIMAYPDTEYIPQQPKEKLLEYYRGNDLYVMPSRTETFGLVYAEAISQGLPVLYTRGQGFDGQFEDGEVGYAVAADNPREIAERIVAAAERQRELTQNCLERCGRFNWKDICRQYRDLYTAILAKHHPASYN
jgi:glycosyltransferase involved in cell wall biosynthesis